MYTANIKNLFDLFESELPSLKTTSYKSWISDYDAKTLEDGKFQLTLSVLGHDPKNIKLEVTDDKSLEKSVRKQKQIEHAASISHEAKLVKLADKISNLTDILNSPPTDWSEERKKEYFLWAKAVVDNLRGAHQGLEKDFDDLFNKAKAIF